jgi:hypothetical protein
MKRAGAGTAFVASAAARQALRGVARAMTERRYGGVSVPQAWSSGRDEDAVATGVLAVLKPAA